MTHILSLYDTHIVPIRHTYCPYMTHILSILSLYDTHIVPIWPTRHGFAGRFQDAREPISSLGQELFDLTVVCVCVCVVCTCTLSKTHTHTHAHDTKTHRPPALGPTRWARRRDTPRSIEGPRRGSIGEQPNGVYRGR